MSNPRLMVLGASTYQLPIIQAARKLGCFVIALDNRPENPGHALAHQTLNIDTTARETVLEAARSLGINGIIAACTDVALPTAAYVAQELSLVAPPLEASYILTNKARFREFQQSIDLPSPLHFLVSSIADVPDNMQGKEWIFKPTRSSGSRGIRRIETTKAAIEWYKTVSTSGMDNIGILEEFLIGKQGTIEGFYQDQQIKWSFLMDRQTASEPYVGTLGQLFPANVPSEIESRLKCDICRIFKTLKIESSFFDADFIWNRNSATLLELTPRLGGNSIIKLVHAASGLDLATVAVQHCLGKTPRWDDLSPTSSGVEILGAERDGILRYSPSAVEKLRTMEWIEYLELDYPPNVQVTRFMCGRDRLGEIIVKGKNRAEVESRLSRTKKELGFEIE